MKFERCLASGLALCILAGQAFADNILIRSNTVIPIVMDDELSFKESREGDRFFATVDDSRDLPYGTRLEGKVLAIELKRGKQPAYMDVEFNTLILPDGQSHSIRAVPISLDSKHITKDRDGRLVAKQSAIRKDHYVWGGVVGGAILGSILGRKTFEGAFVGAVAGIILAETSAKQEEFALKRGTRMGAIVEREVDLPYTGQWDRNARYDRSDRSDKVNGTARTDQYDQLDRYEETIRIEFGGRELRFSGSEKPYRMGETVMVPLDRAASQLGLEVQYAGDMILIEDDDTMLRLEQDSDRYRLNGRRGNLPRNIVKRGEVIYVPLDALAATKSESVHVNGTKVRDISLK